MLLNFTQWRQLDWKLQNMDTSGVCSIVADPWLFGVDPDPDLDPRIHASDQWIRIWISSLTFKMPTKKLIFLFKIVLCLLLFEGVFTSFSKIKSQKEVTKQ